MHNPSALITPLKALLAPYLQHFQNDILSLVASSAHPKLTQLVQYYIQQPSKRLRPCLILLMSQATNGLGSEWHLRSSLSLNKEPVQGRTATGEGLDNILPAQLLLAQIVEVLHVASLLHDDVIDQAQTRRGAPSAPAVFGTCHTILGGDYLLGRIMTLGAKLGSSEAMSFIGQIVCTLVEGEFLQDDDLKSECCHTRDPDSLAHVLHSATGTTVSSEWPRQDAELSALWEKYLTQTYMKTASLFSLALQCCVALGGSTPADPWREVAASYGECLGMAFQLVDDLLDYEGDQAVLGKPANADLKQGIITAPVFFALQEDESIRPLVLRRFSHSGDVEKVSESVRKTQALSRTRALAECYARGACEALAELPDSAAKTALCDLTKAVLVRRN